MEDNMHYVYLCVENQYISYSNGNFSKERYFLTDNINKAFYFGCVPTKKHLMKICEQLNVNLEQIQIIPDEHYITGLSNIRKIIYKRNNWK